MLMKEENALNAKKNEEEMIRAEKIRMEKKALRDMKRRELAHKKELKKRKKQDMFRQTATMNFARQQQEL
jgi:hypothetical protein